MKSILFALLALALPAIAADKKLVVMIAGKPSHGPGQHEHNAGVQLLKKCLEQNSACLLYTSPSPRD